MFNIKQTNPIRRTAGEAGKRPENLRFVYFLTGFVFIDQGVMGVIVADARWIRLMKPANSWVTGAVVSLYDIGCLVGTVSIGFLANHRGRERTLSIACVVFIIGAILQSASYNITSVTVGHVILGYGVGTCAGGVPLYVSEIAPAKLRDRIIGIEQMILCFGELVAFWLNYGFNFLETPNWWRIPLAIQVVPAAIWGVGCWFWVLPSPRWLVQQDRHQCAREVLARLHGDEVADLQMAEIAEEVAFENAITGINSILYYTIPIFLFDRLGRKIWLRTGLVGMYCAMVGITVLQWHAERDPDSNVNYAIIAFPYLFYVFFDISWGVGSWTYATEIFPVVYRAKGNALSTASLWLSCYVVAQASPPIAAPIGWGLYIIYSCICVVTFIFVRYAMVETKGETIEEMSALFGIESKLVRRSGMEVDGKIGIAHVEDSKMRFV
ncbi:putative sugar transporter [Daldinia decipiens]|uniref:putative sugar transporter n=1 Tax=Daldinia decipiens TaxID=326647 RepID=UPI0020C35FAA|nr:putative sugar transporter [Daldinia decipiens]KAI1658573.1 putative sugar transporter [Daldinia decipiens]